MTLLGVVADDLTGATDLATATVEEGLSALVVLGVPDETLELDADVVVVALKSRTAEPALAVAESTRAARRLLDLGADRLYQKYCSTFDSTDRGNIGPVAEALADLLGTSAVSVGTPATPAVGREQFDGHLFVDGRPLHESPLRDHPLTPMRDPDLVRVLARQSTRPVSLVRHAAVRRGADAVRDELGRIAADGAGHVLVDSVSDADLRVVADALLASSGPIVLGGGAGLARAVATELAPHAGPPTRLPAVPDGGRLILSGSASARTREQVAAHRGPIVRVDPLALAAGRDAVEALSARVREHLGGDDPVLVSATDDPDQVRAVQAELGTEGAATIVEEALAAIARTAVDRDGVTRLLVAGGETSGAVAAALGVRVLRIGRLAAPGVPWTVAERDAGEPLGLLLKSGNFGGPDLFSDAWEVAP